MSGWFNKMKDEIFAISRMPHEWGKTDCCCQAARCAEIKSGIDYMAPYRGRYSSYEEALELVRAMGFKEPVEVVASMFKEIARDDAGNGDVAAVEGVGGTIAFGIFIGDKIFVQTEHGLGRLQRSKALLAFEVPLWQQLSPPS